MALKRASHVSQLVKNLLAMQETWVPSLGCEDLLEKGAAIHSSILAWETPGQRSLAEESTGVTKSQAQLSN